MNVFTRFFGGLSERVLAVLFALLALQFPVYYTAYTNTVAGAQFEAQARYEQLQREAAELKIALEEFIVRHERSSDQVFQASGRIHRTTLARYQRYSAMLNDLRAAQSWRKPLALQRNFDSELIRATRFEPGLTLSLEAAAYALAGLLLAWLLTAGAGALLRPRRVRASF